MFGSSTFGKPASNAFGAFGASNNQQQPSNAGGGGVFGNFGAPTNQNQGQNQPSGTTLGGSSIFGNQPAGSSLFGGANTGQSGGGGIFGTSNATQPTAGGSTLFGSNPGTGIFGSNAGQPATGPGAPAGSTLFGTTNTQPGNNAAGTSGNLFSNPFSSVANQSTSTGGGLFGGQGNTAFSTATNPPSSFGAFGQSTQGATQNQQQAQPTTSLFGQQPQQQQQQQGSIFGNLGQSTAAPNVGASGGLGLFGQASSTAQPNTFSFGVPNAGSSSTSNLFASRGAANSGQVQQQGDSAHVQFNSLLKRIESIARSWDSTSHDCRFQHYFYNLVDPSQVHMYGRPANATDEASWQKAVRENPDPTCYVPALAHGFDDLQKRVEAQRQQSAAHQEKIKELKARISALAEKHSLSTAPHLQRAAALQIQLSQRLVRLVQHLHLLIPSVRSSSIRPEEEALRATLESLEDEIKRPGGTGRLKGKLNELWALIGAIEAAKERDRKGGDGNIEWTVVDQDGLQRIAQILAEQQNGIAHLTKIVQGHLKSLDIILGKDSQEQEEDPFSGPQARQVLMGASVRGAS